MNQFLKSFCFAFLVLIIIVKVSYSSVPTINGKVVDALTGEPVVGATVTTDTGGFTATTDGNGDYVFLDLVAGDYVITVTADGYETATETVAFTEDRSITLNFPLLPLLPTPDASPTISPTPSTFSSPTPTVDYTPTPVSTCSINSKVVDALTGNPIAGATITLEPGGVTATTDENGDYILLDLPAGDYVITVTAPGYEPAAQSLAVVEGQFVTVNFPLLPLLPSPMPGISPTPTVSPTSCTEINSIEINSRKITIKRNTSDDITVTVTCDDGLPVEGVMVIASINKAGNKRISILPESTITNENGQATFTITAKNKTGNARVVFEADNLKKSVVVKVRK